MYDESGKWRERHAMPAPHPMNVSSVVTRRMPPPVPPARRLQNGIQGVIPTDDYSATNAGLTDEDSPGMWGPSTIPVEAQNVYQPGPAVRNYQKQASGLQDFYAKQAAKPWWEKALRDVGAAGAEFVAGHRAPGLAAGLSSEIQHPGLQSRLAQLGLARQSADEERLNQQLAATTGLRNAIYQANTQNRAGMQANRLQRAGAEPIATMPPPTPPPSVGMPATVTSSNVPPLRPGAMPPPTPPTVTGGQNAVPPALGAAMTANSTAPMSNRIANYEQTNNPITGPVQVPPVGEKNKMDMMSASMAEALSRPQDAGQHFEPAQMRQFEAEVERRRNAPKLLSIPEYNSAIDAIVPPGDWLNTQTKALIGAAVQRGDAKAAQGEIDSARNAVNQREAARERGDLMTALNAGRAEDREAARADRQARAGDIVEKQKQDALNAASTWEQQQLNQLAKTGAFGSGYDDQVAAIHQQASERKQAAMTAYTQAVRRRGGTAPDFVVNEDGSIEEAQPAEASAPAAAPRGAAGAPAAAGRAGAAPRTRTIPESRIADVVARAKAAGMNLTPQQAAKQLQDEGWTILKGR